MIEVAWAIALKETHGFTRLAPTLVFLPLYLLSALRLLPIGLIAVGVVWLAVGEGTA